jgi:CRP/FNR family transcriptional regulator
MADAQAFGRESPKAEPSSLCPSCAQQDACDLLRYVPRGTPLCTAALKRRRALQRGDVLFRQYDKLTALYLVRKGSLKTEQVTPSGQLVVTGFCFPGDLVGLESLSGHRQMAGGVALENSEVCEFDVRRLVSLCAQYPALSEWFVRRLGQGLREKDAALCWTTRMKCCDRVLRFFVELNDRLGTSAAHPPGQVQMPMTKHDIAMYLNMSPETLSRTLGALRDEGALRVSGSTFVVMDVELLRQRTSL